MKFEIKKVSGEDCSNFPGAVVKEGFMDVRWPDNERGWQSLREKGVSKDSVEVKNGRLHAKLPQNYWEIEIKTLGELRVLQESIVSPLIIK